MALEEVPFSSLLSAVVDNRGRTCPTAAVGIPLIATNCVRNDLLYPTYEKVRFISKEIYVSWFRGHPKPGDILFVNKATPGRVCLAPDPIDFCIAQDMVAVRADPDKVYPRYLFAVLRSPLAQERIGQMHVGSLIPHFKKGDFDKLLLPVPGRAVQEFVGDTYFDLSAKIELNRRRNQTLEAMARALFKDWFVDFGPVRAKMGNREPYLPADLWQLFPDRLADEGKPEGWDERPLDEIADFLNGLALQKFPATDPDNSLPVIKIAELRSGISVNSDRASREVPAKYVIKDGDLLFSWSGSLLAKFWTEGEGALNQHLFKVTSENYPIWFVSHWVHHHLEEFQAIAASKATTMGHIQRGHLKAAMTRCPPRDVLERLGVVMSPLVEQSIHNELESRTLAQLRDTLLPKLISGELRIADADQFLEKTQ
jgi:type I restriction enzyme S subunit